MDDQVIQETAPEQTTETQESRTNADHIYQMRKKLEEAEYEKRLAIRRAEEAERRAQQYQPQQAPQVDEDDIVVSDDDYVQAKLLKAAQKKNKSQYQDQAKQIELLKQQHADLEARMVTDMIPDFHTVCSEDNLRALAKEDPDNYESIMHNPNLRSRSKAAYNLIKKLNIAQSVTQDYSYKDKIISNKQKPQAASVAGAAVAQTPLSSFGDGDRLDVSNKDADRIMKDYMYKKDTYVWKK